MANASDPVNAIADSNRNSRSKMRRLHNQASTPADSAETVMAKARENACLCSAMPVYQRDVWKADQGLGRRQVDRDGIPPVLGCHLGDQPHLADDARIVEGAVQRTEFLQRKAGQHIGIAFIPDVAGQNAGSAAVPVDRGRKDLQFRRPRAASARLAPSAANSVAAAAPIPLLAPVTMIVLLVSSMIRSPE